MRIMLLIIIIIIIIIYSRIQETHTRPHPHTLLHIPPPTHTYTLLHHQHIILIPVTPVAGGPPINVEPADAAAFCLSSVQSNV